MDQDETWCAVRPQLRPHCVSWGPKSPSPKGVQPLPRFSAHVYCGQMAGWIKMSLSTEVGLGPVDIVLNGDSAPYEKRVGTEPPILAHVYCGQTVRWIKMPLGTEIELGSGHIVFDGDQVPPPLRKGHSSPLISADV